MNQENTTWKCPKCGSIMSGNFCSNCAQKRPIDEEKICICGCKNPTDAKYCTQCGKLLDHKVDFKIIIIAIICVIILAAIFLKPHQHKWNAATCTTPQTCNTCGEINGSAPGHRWDSATCTTSKTCSVCGETSGSALGHNWKDATCTSPKTCSNCGETSGNELGHNWKDATYEAPKTCTICGKTEGTVKSPPKGYIAKLSGSNQKVTLHSGNSTLNVHALVLNEKVYKCKQLTFSMDVEMKAGTHCSDWDIWGRVDGKFKKIGSIYLPSGDGFTSQIIYFNNPITFDAIVAAPTIPGGYSWALAFAVTDVYAS